MDFCLSGGPGPGLRLLGDGLPLLGAVRMGPCREGSRLLFNLRTEFIGEPVPSLALNVASMSCKSASAPVGVRLPGVPFLPRGVSTPPMDWSLWNLTDLLEIDMSGLPGESGELDCNSVIVLFWRSFRLCTL